MKLVSLVTSISSNRKGLLVKNLLPLLLYAMGDEFNCTLPPIMAIDPLSLESIRAIFTVTQSHMCHLDVHCTGRERKRKREK